MRSLWNRPPRRHRRVRRTRIALNLSRLRRSTVALATVAAAAATLTGLVAKGALDEAMAARARWGELASVAIVARDVAAGSVLTPGDVRADRRPRRLLPDAPLPIDSVVGRVALTDLHAGEVVIDGRVASDLVPAGWLAIAIAAPSAGSHPDVAIGDAVEVIDVGADGSSVSTASGIVVAARDEHGSVTVAVPATAAPRIAYAAIAGTAVVGLTATRPHR